MTNSFEDLLENMSLSVIEMQRVCVSNRQNSVGQGV